MPGLPAGASWWGLTETGYNQHTEGTVPIYMAAFWGVLSNRNSSAPNGEHFTRHSTVDSLPWWHLDCRKDRGWAPYAPRYGPDRLQQAGSRVNKDKFFFMVKAVEYLGHAIDAEGLHPLPGKVEAVQNAPSPQDVSQLRSYLGLVHTWNLHGPHRRNCRWYMTYMCMV